MLSSPSLAQFSLKRVEKGGGSLRGMYHNGVVGAANRSLGIFCVICKNGLDYKTMMMMMMLITVLCNIIIISFLLVVMIIVVIMVPLLFLRSIVGIFVGSVLLTTLFSETPVCHGVRWDVAGRMIHCGAETGF